MSDKEKILDDHKFSLLEIILTFGISVPPFVNSTLVISNKFEWMVIVFVVSVTSNEILTFPVNLPVARSGWRYKSYKLGVTPVGRRYSIYKYKIV